MLGPTVRRPPSAARSLEAALGRDHQILRVRVQRLGDQRFADMRTVRIGGIDEVHAELVRSPQDRLGGIAIGRFAPYPVARDAHRAVPETMHREITADTDGPRRGRRG